LRILLFFSDFLRAILRQVLEQYRIRKLLVLNISPQPLHRFEDKETVLLSPEM
jgi:hypothetical protein